MRKEWQNLKRAQCKSYERYNEVFKDRSEDFSIDFLRFQKKISAHYALCSRKKDEKEKYLDKFSVNNWEKMAFTEKSEHSFANSAKDAIIAMPKFKLYFQSSKIN